MSEPTGQERDRSRYVVPVVVAAIAAVATIGAAVLPLLLRDDPGGASSDASASGPRTTGGSGDASAGTDAAGRTSPGTTGAAGGPVWVQDFQVLTAVFGDDADLDADARGNRGDKVPDIVVTEEALRISDGARLALLDKSRVPGLDTCTTEVAAHPVDSVDERDVQPGTALCYRTSGGRVGMLTISQARKSTQNDVSTIYILTVNYVTWSG